MAQIFSSSKKCQATVEFLSSLLLLLVLLLAFGAISSNMLSASQKSQTNSIQENQLSKISLNLGIIYCSTSAISPSNINGGGGRPVGIGANSIFFAGGEKMPTLNPGGGGEYALIHTTIPN